MAMQESSRPPGTPTPGIPSGIVDFDPGPDVHVVDPRLVAGRPTAMGPPIRSHPPGSIGEVVDFDPAIAVGPGLTYLGRDVNPGLFTVPATAPDPGPARSRRAEPVETQADRDQLDDIFRRHNPLTLPIPARGRPSPQLDDRVMRAALDRYRLGPDDAVKLAGAIRAGVTSADRDDAVVQAALARLGPDDAKRLAGAIRAAVEDLGKRIGGAHSNAGGGRDWPATIYPLLERRARLRAAGASLEALAAGRRIDYRAPTRADVEGQFSELVARWELGGEPLSRFLKLVSAASRRARRLEARQAEVGAALDRAFAPGDPDVEGQIATAVALEAERAELESERSEADKSLGAIGLALAAAVKPVIEAAGGLTEVAVGLVEAGLLDPSRRGADHPGAGELARIEAQLSSLGANATTATPGRLVKELQAAHKRHTADLGRRRKADRRALESEAAGMVRGALRGDLDAFEALAAAVRSRPAAFAAGFGKALSAVPLQAVEQAGFRPFAAAVGFSL